MTWFTDERGQSCALRGTPDQPSKGAMLTEITPERLDALLFAAATVTTTLVAVAMIWFAVFVF